MIEVLTLTLPDVLKPHTELLQTIAESWIAYGATNIAIWGDGQIYANWAGKKQDITESQPTHTQITAQIMIGEERVAQLHVFGPSNRVKKKRLRLDAKVIGQHVHNHLLLEEQTTLKRRILSLQNQIEEHGTITAELEADLTQTEKYFDAFLHLAQIYLENLDLAQYLYMVRDIAIKLLPVESAFTISDSLEAPQQLESTPQPFASPQKITHYLMNLAPQDEIVNNYPNIRDLPTSIRNMIAMPAIANETVRVRLGLVNKANGEFTNGDVDILRMFTELVGRHIETLLQSETEIQQTELKAEMEVAFEVQHHLFPQEPPEILGLDIYAYSRAAKHVGGDFYDYFVRYDGQLAFSVGDVSGKGMSSALMMAITRTLLKNKSNRGDLLTPQAIMSETVGDLYEDFMRVQMFATAFVGFYNPLTMQLTYANAGHGPVIYCPYNGEPQFLEAGSPPIGVLAGTYALDEILQLNPGDCIVIATDGLSEALDLGGEQFGETRLMQIIQSRPDYSAADVARVLFNEIDAFVEGSAQSDDQTILVLKIT